MRIINVDLYDYFKIKKPEGAAGTLTGYIADLSREINPARKRPAMLVIPGGGYGMTSDREAEPVALRYLSYGWNAFVIRYSCAPIKYPYPLVEAIMAMNYIKLNAALYATDENKVAAVGFSAGGHLTAMLGSYYDSPEAAEIFRAQVNARPDAVVLSYPVITSGEKAHRGSFDNLCGVDNAELQKKLDIANLVNEKSSPAFIWATRDDNCVPVKNALVAACAYEEAGVPFSLHIWGTGCHGISLDDLTVYGGESPIVAASKSIPEWVGLSIEFMAELGVKVE